METNNEIITPTSQLDTNAEYISVKGVHDQPPIITSVFKSIFVEIPKEFYVGIRNFFLRFINLFKDGFKYLKYPSLKIDPFATKDYKESCQHTFEFSLVITALLIFLIKLDFIFGEENIKAVYNNDISQALMQFFIFICFAVYYSVLVVVWVLAGRLFRIIFKLPVTRQECDILFTYLNNVLFLITASLAFILRCIVPFRNIKGDEDAAGGIIFIVYGLIFGIMIYRWAGRFALLNNLNPSTKLRFKIVVTIVTTIFFAFCSLILTSFIWGV